jgi:hypothetical protein
MPGAFVVNIGDIIDTLTGHQYKSTYHRVIHRGETYRVSIPFFFEPMRDMVIKPFTEMMAPGVTVQPFTYFDHLKASRVDFHFTPSTVLVLCSVSVPESGTGRLPLTPLFLSLLHAYHASHANRKQSMIYRHFVANDRALPDKPNSNELTNRG